MSWNLLSAVVTFWVAVFALFAETTLNYKAGWTFTRLAQHLDQLLGSGL
jgi:hypothetical protein